MVPPQCGVWIPGGMPHSNRATANASICFLYVDAGAAVLPEECCTLSITPLLHELIQRLASVPPLYPPEGPMARLVALQPGDVTVSGTPDGVGASRHANDSLRCQLLPAATAGRVCR